MPHGITVREAIQRLDHYGLIREDAALALVDDASLDEDLEWHGYNSSAEAIVELSRELGIGFPVSCDRVMLEDGYADALSALSECAGDGVDITNVRLDRSDELTVRFEFNGEPQEWTVDDYDERYLDQMAFIENVYDLRPPGDREWAYVGNEEIYDNYFLFGEREKLRRLAADFAVELQFSNGEG
ncbi:hypothetical protein [Stackebrandtia soli]|uniref:hypothetical protein n=1 Tax=Stackebrandtia soli TaxID=1892856 RepID=UPI0039ECF6CE